MVTSTERDDKLGGNEGSQSRSHPMTFSISKTRELCDAATEGPWVWFTSCSWKRLKHDRRGLTLNVAEPFVASDGHPDLTISREDMAFIAHARTALPQALDEIERLTADADRFRDEYFEMLQGLAKLSPAACLATVKEGLRQLIEARARQGGPDHG